MKSALHLLPGVLSALFFSCSPRPDLAQQQGMAMGTFATIAVPRADAGRLPRAADIMRESFETLEATLSVYRPESDLSRLREARAGDPVSVSPLTREAVGLALRYAADTGGAFDPTVGPLMDRWGFRAGGPPAHRPEPDRIEAAMRRVGFGHVLVTSNAIVLARPGMDLDLGGIAKGLAVDRVHDALRPLDLSGFMVNLGGNIRVSGTAAPGRDWSIGVRDPFDGDRLLGVLRLPDGMAAATSGHYERFVEIEGVRYAHIMDPRTGLPVRGMAGVTVVSRSATEADALSTALFVAGVEAGLSLLERFPDSQALFVPDEQPIRLIQSPGFAAFFSPAAGLETR
jgi:thiamine biosynthesis lipoprotein